MFEKDINTCMNFGERDRLPLCISYYTNCIDINIGVKY